MAERKPPEHSEFDVKMEELSATVAEDPKLLRFFKHWGVFDQEKSKQIGDSLDRIMSTGMPIISDHPALHPGPSPITQPPTQADLDQRFDNARKIIERNKERTKAILAEGGRQGPRISDAPLSRTEQAVPAPVSKPTPDGLQSPLRRLTSRLLRKRR